MNEECRKAIELWVKKCGNKDLVLVIGAGFSKNAQCVDSSRIPLWSDIIRHIKDEIKMPECDPLLAFDIYKKVYGLNCYESYILEMLNDDQLRPGEAHRILGKIPNIKAIITTNNIDTLLDKTFPDAKRIIDESDVSKDSNLKIYYLHGHRSKPESWIFSFTDYDDIKRKYPLKTSDCKKLLEQYPSLFIGFGHSDPDLHRIMRSVHETMKGHKPAMLSLSVDNDEIDSLAQYWREEVGLTIVKVTDPTNDDIRSQVVESLKFIARNRIDSLKRGHKLSPGYHIENSFMDNIRSNKLDCKEKKGKVFLCEYHQSRSETIIMHIENSDEIVLYSPYTTKIKPSEMVNDIFKKMKSGVNPTGSWGLMPSHREWLLNGVSSYFNLKQIKEVKILIAGVGGLPHFVDTMSLLFSLSNRPMFRITVLDICCGPLHEINQYIKNNCYKHHEQDENIYQEVHKLIMDGNAIIECNRADLLNDEIKEKYDIILAHHLISCWFYDKDKTEKIEKYAKTVNEILKNGGIHISAMNTLPNDEKCILEFQEIMIRHSLSVIDTKIVFDLYDIDNERTFDDNTLVDNETLLTIHRKSDG